MKRFLLTWRTIRYLQSRQAFFQVWYRIKRSFIPFFRYDRYFNKQLHQIKFRFPELIIAKDKYSEDDGFTFLHLSKKFENGVNWNFLEYGKLWNYNLQYFDYLMDPHIDENKKQQLIESFCDGVLNKKIVPEPYAVSLRLINWALYYSQSGYTSGKFENVLKYEAAYLFNNPEYHIGANHLLENYISLFLTSYLFHDEPLCRWALSKLQRELDEQVLEDGAHYECSPMYHSIILGRLLLLLDIIDQNEWITVNKAGIVRHTVKMLGWLKSFQFKNKTWAFVNDATAGIAPDSGILFKMAELLMLQIPDINLGVSGFRKFHSNEIEVLIDAGNIIPSYQPGHAHCDMLGFYVNYNNRPFIVDTGISTYEVNERRLLERKTASHNTVSIGGADQSEIWESFRMGRRAVICIKDEGKNSLIASHDGYRRNFGAVHERSFNLRQNILTITDSVIKHRRRNCSPELSAYLHFDHTVEIERVNGNAFLINGDIHLNFSGPGSVELFLYEQALGYNLLHTATALKIKFEGMLITTISFP